MKKPRSLKVRTKAIKRCDLLPSPLNAGKAQIVHATIVDRHRRGASLVARDQWRRLFENGALNKNARPVEHERIKKVVGSAARVQMLARQVAGQIASWLSNRQNEFRDVVEASSLDDRTRHQLHTVNSRKAWFSREPLCIHKEAEPIPGDIRRLACRIMHAVMARHRRPHGKDFRFSWTSAK